MVLLILCIVFFLSNWLILAVILITWLPFLFGVFVSYLFLRALRCTFKLLSWVLSNFFMEAFITMNFPFSTDFIVSHKFDYAVLLFLVNYRKSLISLFLPWPQDHWLDRCSISVSVYIFLHFWYCWIPPLINVGPLTLKILFQIFLDQLRLALWLTICSILE